MLEIVNYSLVFAGLCGLFGGFYRFNTLEATRVRHHERIVTYADAVARATWFERVKVSLNTITRWLDRVYGPPNATGTRFRHFMTDRAWRASATIVAFYLFILPVFAAAFLFAIWYYLPNETVKGISQWMRACIAVGTVLIALVLVWLIVKRIRLQTRNTTKSPPRLFDNARLPLLVIAIFLGPIELAATFGVNIVSQIVGIGTMIVALFIYMYWLVITIWNFTLRSPIIIGIGTFVILVSLSGFFAIYTPVGFFNAQYHDAATQIWTQFPIASVLSSIFAVIITSLALIYVAWTGLEYFKRRVVPRRLIYTMWGAVLAIYPVSLVLGPVWASIEGISMAPLGLGFTFLGLFIFVQFFLLVYTPIYSNSIPDSVSMGFTRYCIRKCSKAIQVSELVYFALIDCAVAVACVLMSGALFFIGGGAVFLTSEVLIKILSQFGGDATTGDLSAVSGMSVAGQFFMTNVSAVYLSIFESIGLKHSIVLNETYLKGTELFRQFVAFFIFTALIPSVLNLLVIFMTGFAHVAARVSSSFAERVHALLLEVDQQGEPVAIWRSTSLIGIIGGTMLASVLAAAELVF